MQNKKRLLIIDDDEMYLKAVKIRLESDHIEVRALKECFGVTDCLRDFQPNLVLLDINMPGLSGDQVSRIIKPYCDAIKAPIVFNSADNENSLGVLAKAHGVLGYVCKGSFPDWKNKVHQYLAVKA